MPQDRKIPRSFAWQPFVLFAAMVAVFGMAGVHGGAWAFGNPSQYQTLTYTLTHEDDGEGVSGDDRQALMDWVRENAPAEAIFGVMITSIAACDDDSCHDRAAVRLLPVQMSMMDYGVREGRFTGHAESAPGSADHTDVSLIVSRLCVNAMQLRGERGAAAMAKYCYDTNGSS